MRLLVCGIIVGFFVGCKSNPPVDVLHEGMVVNLSSDTEGRRPLLRVDVTLQYDKNVLKGHETQLSGAEAKAAILRALAELDTVEVITEDKPGAIEQAEESIREKITEAGLPAPVDVKITSFVIQG